MTTRTHQPESDDTLDTSGLLCPLPVYKAAIALGRLEAGQVLQLICTDPGSLADIPAMARQRGDVLLASDEDGTCQTFWIEKGTTL
ncbi:MAG: sulfurtransferase TusA family protein [Acidimicrobiia bacterium]|nr:sulfurtransferase TusA family protein [Acidimicrobiia bacterium]MDX2466196.1 sulfurtransferase TusA family protein [Acidimicrobiia bacterium]